MSSNTTLADKGLVRGSVKVTIDGVIYLLKTGQRQKPVVSKFEKKQIGRPHAYSHVKDFEKMSGEIMAYAGTAEPSQLQPFLYDGTYWTVGNLTLNYATEGLRSYTCEITALAGTSPADFVTSTA
jgi:hypothetical protein